MQMEQELNHHVHRREIDRSVEVCISLAARIAHGACSGSCAPSTEHQSRCAGLQRTSTLPAVAPATAVQFLTCFSV